MKLRKLLLFSLAFASGMSYASAQKIKLVEYEEGTQNISREFPDKSFLQVFYSNNDVKENEEELLCEKEVVLFVVPDASIVVEGQEVEFTMTVEKMDHKGDINWGVSQFCKFGQCIKVPDGYTSDKITAKGNFSAIDEYGNPNSISIHYGLKGKYLNGNQINTEHNFLSRLTIAPVNPEESNSISLDIMLRNIKYLGTEAVHLNKVAIISNLGGDVTLSYNGDLKNLNLQVFDLQGHQIYTSKLPAGSSTYKIPTVLPQGIAIFRINANGKPVFAEKCEIR